MYHLQYNDWSALNPKRLGDGQFDYLYVVFPKLLFLERENEALILGHF